MSGYTQARCLQDYETPWWFYNWADQRWGPFTLDAAASAENAKVKDHFFTQEQDSLVQEWSGKVWCNPPYGRMTGPFVQKARKQTEQGYAQRVALLVHPKTDTIWWHDHVPFAKEVACIKGRIKFVNGGESPRDQHVIIIFEEYYHGPPILTFFDVKEIKGDAK